MESTTPGAPSTAQVPGGELDRLIFAPALGLSALIIVLCATVSFRVPLHGVVAPVESVCAVFLVAFCWRWRRSRSARPFVLIGLLAAFAGWLALSEYAGKWSPGGADVLGLHPDSWSYQAFADYLDHYPRGRADGMSMVDEFAAHLSGTRFASATLFAFLHELPVLADVPTTHLTFSMLCMGVHFFSMLALGRALVGRTDWALPLLSAFLATAGGWFGRIVLAANYDNMIFASLSPALIALCCVPPADGSPGVRWRTLAAIALLFAAMLYNYPEGVALLGILCLPLAVAYGWLGVRGGLRPGRWMEVGGGIALGVGLALPYLPTFVAFLQNQLASGLHGGSEMRPGENLLPGLLGGNRLAGAFALGDEMAVGPTHPASNVLPLCLLALMALGAGFIARRQRWFPWVALPLLGLGLWQNVAKHYDYGTYKVLVMASWWVYPAMGAGVFWIAERCKLASWGTAGLIATLLVAIGTVKGLNRVHLPPVALAGRLHAIQELSTLHFVTGQSPVLLALDDDFDYLWATYYLRGLPLGVGMQRSYLAMPHITPLLARGVRPPVETCPFTLVTGPQPDPIWQNSRFSLVRTRPFYLENLENPVNGLEKVGERRFLWIGTQPATFRIFAAHPGHYDLSAARFDFGPSMAGRAHVRAAVTDAAGTHELEITPATASIPIDLAAGDNAVAVRCLDTPEPGPHNGDNRELMLGVMSPDVVPANGAGP